VSAPCSNSMGDEVLAVRLVNLVNRADIRMIWRAGGSEGFPLEPFAGAGSFSISTQAGYLSATWRCSLRSSASYTTPIAAATELFQDAIVRDGLADHFACAAVRRRSSVEEVHQEESRGSAPSVLSAVSDRH